MVRPLHRAALSLPLLAALLFLEAPASAQKPPEHDLLMRLDGMNSRDREKVVLAAINDQDPLALVSIDAPGQQVKIRTIVALDRPSLDARLAVQGMTIMRLGPIDSPGHEHRSAAAVPLPGFPTYVETGDPVHDGASYGSAKAAWIADHPLLYPPADDPPATEPR